MFDVFPIDALRNWLSESVEPMKLLSASSRLNNPDAVSEDEEVSPVPRRLENFPIAFVVVLTPRRFLRVEERELEDEPVESVVSSTGHPPFH